MKYTIRELEAFSVIGQEVSLAQRARSIPIEISPVLRDLITVIFCD